MSSFRSKRRVDCHLLDGADVECSCHVPKVEHRLCKCVIAALVKLQKPVQNHVFDEDKSTTWREQYASAIRCAVPSIPDVSELPVTCPFKAPIAFSANKGAKAKRALSSRDYMIKQAVKKKRKEYREERERPPPTPQASPAPPPRPRRKPSKKKKAPAAAPAPPPRRPRRGRDK